MLSGINSNGSNLCELPSIHINFVLLFVALVLAVQGSHRNQFCYCWLIVEYICSTLQWVHKNC